MIKLSTLTVLYTVLFISNAYCCSFDGNETNVGTLNPTSGYQVQANISNGDYFSVNVNCGDSYNFNFCNNGGSSTWDTQLTLLMLDGTTQLAYNDDAACGLPSDVSWTADFTGTIYVLVSQFSCDNTGGSTGATLAYNVTPGTTDPSFTLAVSCGGGVATITGTSGGSFAFNPTPGDGAQVDATTGQISNGTAGSTYTIEYTICSSSSTQSVTVIEDECWTLSGNALNFVDVNGENCIQLTDGSNTGETGCAWNGKQVDFSTDFSLTLDYYFGTGGSNGADGTTFTFQPSSSVACGLDGGQLGAGGIPNSLVIEFDTYDNDNPAHIYDMACDHIALEIDGNLQNTTPFCGPVCAKSSGNAIDDGGTYTIEIRWNAASQQLEIYFDGALRLSCNNDFVSNVFGQNMVYWGASAATGGLVNQQYFCPNTVTVLPIELGEFYSSCSNNTEKLTWTTLSENNVDYFIIEYTLTVMFFTLTDMSMQLGSLKVRKGMTSL